MQDNRYIWQVATKRVFELQVGEVFRYGASWFRVWKRVGARIMLTYTNELTHKTESLSAGSQALVEIKEIKQ